MEHETDVDSDCNRCTWNKRLGISKETERLWNKRTNGYHRGNCFIKIDQNTEKSPGNLRRLAVTQTQVINHGVKNSQENKLIIQSFRIFQPNAFLASASTFFLLVNNKPFINVLSRLLGTSYNWGSHFYQRFQLDGGKNS